MTTVLACWGFISLLVVVAIVGVLVYLNNKKKIRATLDKVQDK